MDQIRSIKTLIEYAFGDKQFITFDVNVCKYIYISQLNQTFSNTVGWISYQVFL